MYRQFNRAEGATGCGPAFDKRQFRGHHHGFNPDRAGKTRAPVSIYKTENTYELLVFAPGRVKELFRVNVKGNELIVSYTPAENTPSPEWIRKEYSRGGFERSFLVEETVNTEDIAASYEDGVLKLTLPLKPGSEPVKQEITVN